MTKSTNQHVIGSYSCSPDNQNATRAETTRWPWAWTGVKLPLAAARCFVCIVMDKYSGGQCQAWEVFVIFCCEWGFTSPLYYVFHCHSDYEYDTISQYYVFTFIFTIVTIHICVNIKIQYEYDTFIFAIIYILCCIFHMFSHFFVHGLLALPGVANQETWSMECKRIWRTGMASYGCSMLEPWEPAGHFSNHTPALRVDDSVA